MASEISVESVCQFISTHGGKVKNTTLVSNFKKYLNNPETKDIARQKFKECVNTVAVVKTENGEKYVQLKKKYRAPSMSSSVSSVNSETVSETVSTNDDPLTSHPTQDEPKASSAHDTSFTPQDEVPYADGVEDQEAPSRAAEPERDSPIYETYDNVVVERKAPIESVPPPELEKEVAQLPPPRADAPAPKSSPVKISITEARDSVANQNEEKAAKRGHENSQRPSSSKPSTGRPDSTGEFAVPAAPHRKKKERKENVPPSPIAEHRFAGSLERAKAGVASSTNEQGRLSRMRPTSVVQTGYPGSVERARLNFQGKKSQNDETSSLALSEKSVDSKGEADDDFERSAPAICLDPSEKLWMIKSCQGNMVEMRKLLDDDPNLAVKKDFVLTSLHWAAKKGNIDMINMLLDQKVDINARSGYTPLHLAAIHGHEGTIAHLLEYEADPSIRDYSGRQPIHYLKAVSLPLQRLLFGNDGTGLTKDFAAGLRPRLDSVRMSNRLSATISGGFSSIGMLMSRSSEDLSRGSSDASPLVRRKGSFKDNVRKMAKKRSKKRKDERPSISIVSIDDTDSGYAGSLSSHHSMTSLPVSHSSPNLQRSAPTTPNTSQKSWHGIRSRSHTDYGEQ